MLHNESSNNMNQKRVVVKYKLSAAPFTKAQQTHPRMLRQTFPFLYKFGLKRTLPPPVVISLTLGVRMG